MTYYTRGKTLHIPDFFKWTNDTEQSTADKPEWIDTSQLDHFQVHVYSTMGLVGGFWLLGTNGVPADAATFALAPTSNDQTSHTPSAFPVERIFTFPDRESSRTLITYKNLPRWVKPAIQTLQSSGKSGVLQIHVFGWMS